ncbi:Phox homologous domain-containing protein [Astrocystis sublimbata]|nr:Phox homologous domain-containing protein [Astrocystis sublimbata]
MAPPAEITIPSTSLHTPTDNSKPYTQYNITLRLPLRTYVVQKRYSEFSTLHATLSSTIGTPPPAPLPAKTWFKSTLKSPELTEDRRRGLEAYMRAIAESPDRRWRDTPAWRTFLNLPGLNSASNSAANVSGYGIPNRDAANTAAAQDPGTWLDLHGEMKRDFQEARRCLARRDAATENAVAIEAGSSAKKALVKAGGLLSCLRIGLEAMESAKRLGQGEIRRRKDLLAAARVDREDLEKLSSTISATARVLNQSNGGSSGAPSAASKAALVGSAASKARGRRVLGAPLPETEQTRELDNEGVAMLQRQLMEDQDQDVEALAKIIRRQREMAEAINREVEEQTEMLDHVHAQTDVVAGKVGVAKKRVKKIS